MAMSKEVWSDKAFVNVSAQGGAEYALQSKTTSISISGGEYEAEGLDTLGGKIIRRQTEEDIEISFDIIPVSLYDFDWIRAGLTAPPAFSATGSNITTSAADTKYRVSFLWTNQASVTGAGVAITGSNEAYRKVYADAYCTSLEQSMDAGDDNVGTITFKLAPKDINNASNVGIFSKDTTSGTLSALSAYTSTVKF